VNFEIKQININIFSRYMYASDKILFTEVLNAFRTYIWKMLLK